MLWKCTGLISVLLSHAWLCCGEVTEIAVKVEKWLYRSAPRTAPPLLLSPPLHIHTHAHLFRSCLEAHLTATSSHWPTNRANHEWNPSGDETKEDNTPLACMYEISYCSLHWSYIIWERKGERESAQTCEAFSWPLHSKPPVWFC